MFLPISLLTLAALLLTGIIANKFFPVFAENSRFARMAPYVAWAAFLLGAFFFPISRVY